MKIKWKECELRKWTGKNGYICKKRKDKDWKIYPEFCEACPIPKVFDMIPTEKKSKLIECWALKISEKIIINKEGSEDYTYGIIECFNEMPKELYKFKIDHENNKTINKAIDKLNDCINCTNSRPLIVHGEKWLRTCEN